VQLTKLVLRFLGGALLAADAHGNALRLHFNAIIPTQKSELQAFIVLRFATLELFSTLYGVEAGNLALKCLPTRVFVGGGGLDVVRAATTEVYATESVPADAVVYFRGVDEHAGALTKYARIEPYANP
jgi:hypothetical protein